MEDLQGILEKINREGVEKAEAESARILAEAQTRATAIVQKAREEAGQLKDEAEKSAAASAARAAETIRQSARDMVLSVRDALQKLLERLLAKNVETALADPAVAVPLAAEAVKAVASSGAVELSVAPRLAAALQAQLVAEAGMQGVKVVTDETRGSGFSVRLDAGRVESAFTADVIAAEIARRLRPELAKLVDDVR